MYDHDVEDLEALGWDEFITRQWESIFIGYRAWAGLRTLGRRWSDLLEAGLGCTQGFADRLVRAEVINSADRDMLGAAAETIVAGMVGVLTDVGTDIAEMDGVRPEDTATLLDRHARLLSYVKVLAYGEDTGEVLPS